MIATRHLEVSPQQLSKLVTGITTATHVCSIILFGSVARKTHTPESDIDLLIISHQHLRPSDLHVVVRSLPEFQVSLVAQTPEKLRKEMMRRPAFFAHLRDEGRVLFDSDHCTITTEIMTDLKLDVQLLSAEIALHLTKLGAYEDIGRFDGALISCAGRVYSIARAILIAKLLMEDVHHYDWRNLLSTYTELHPEATGDVAKIDALTACFNLWRGHCVTFPSVYTSVTNEVLESAIKAIRRIAQYA